MVDCSRQVVEGQRVCDDPIHQSIERLYNLRGSSRFRLVETLERARMAAAAQGGTSMTIDLHDSVEVAYEEDFELDSRGNAVVSGSFFWHLLW